ncbi:MAG TPA: hypothetical protein DDZ78_14195, partial [Porphyromonadaceae bacterium]|nr:hypothetical protein [Porphyromonadaceae bacterium]
GRYGFSNKTRRADYYEAYHTLILRLEEVNNENKNKHPAGEDHRTPDADSAPLVVAGNHGRFPHGKRLLSGYGLHACFFTCVLLQEKTDFPPAPCKTQQTLKPSRQKQLG